MPPPVEGESSHFLTREAAAACAAEIRSAGGVEVFFIGRRGEDGLVNEVESHAFGTDSAVPALTSLASPGDVILHNHPSGQLAPSGADLSIASPMGNLGVGFYIIDNGCTRCRVVVKAQDPPRRIPVEEEDVLRRLSPKGNLARLVADFEERPQQRSMSLAVTRAFNSDGIAVVEAGTGTGKSLAYLIPAVLFALKNKERVVISTNTINLQEQLLHKDIPTLRRALGEEELEVEIVKGRSNYVCRRKAAFVESEGASLLEDDYQQELRQVLQWIKETETGDRQDLPFTPRNDVWERVSSESDNCLRLRCPFYESCFFYNSRRRAARARILVVNHSLLMSDLAIRRASGNYTMAAVLPPYSRVILDEAHHLEEVATNNLAQQISRWAVRQLLGRLYRSDKSGARGVLVSLREEMESLVKRGRMGAEAPLVMTVTGRVMPLVLDVRSNLEFGLQEFAYHFLEVARLPPPRPGVEHKIRLVPALEKDPRWREECLRILQDCAAELSRLVDESQKALELVDELDESIQAALVNPITEWTALVNRASTMRQNLNAMAAPVDGICRWIEIRQPQAGNQDMHVRLCLAPVNVRDVLRESLHDRMKCEVMTSATLTVDGGFDFFNDRAGIPDMPPPSDRADKVEYDEEGLPVRYLEPLVARPCEALNLSTPFDYTRQVYFAVPTDLPDPRETQFDEQLAELVNRAVAITGGRAFILFTSYGQLQRVAGICAPTISRLGIEMLRQGRENRDLLLRRFREDETSVLFATSSFWEGVDVKGRALELLVIARLPFAVPTEPIQEAQFEALKEDGRDPFGELVVPRAVIKFKQGFGRLIRSRTDRGAVIVADRRVVRMNYGRRFLRSLPPVDVRQGSSAELMEGMERFFQGASLAADGRKTSRRG